MTTPNPTNMEDTTWEETEQKLMDILHEFNRENIEEPFDGQPLMRRARKWNYARQIIDIFADKLQLAQERGERKGREQARRDIDKVYYSDEVANQPYVNYQAGMIEGILMAKQALTPEETNGETV